MNMKTSPKVNTLLFLGFAFVFGLAFMRVYMRVQTTLLGYEIGKLKSKEAELLQERSLLQMSYAKITTKNHLSAMAGLEESQKRKPTTEPSLAQNH
jgi:hypothetical protein